MTDEFESRLSDGLARRAGHLPAFDGDLQAIRRRGRTRRWVTRGAGAVGALAILGGGVVAINAFNDDASGGTVTTDDGGDGEAFVPTATPTPAPTPEPTPPPDMAETAPPTEPTPDPLEGSGGPAGPDDASLLVATGWGVGLLNSGTGAIFAPEACCTGSDLRWFDQPDTARAEGLKGAVSVRDDLRGGYVFASRNALHWTPAAYLSDGLEPLLIDLAGTGVNGELSLWDVSEIDGEVTVLYSTTVTSIGDEGEDLVSFDLRSKVLDGAAATTAAEILSGGSIRPGDPARGFLGAAWLPDGGHVTVGRTGPCYRTSVNGTNLRLRPPHAEELAGDPPGGLEALCADSPRIDAMTVSDDGATLALVRTEADAAPELAAFDLSSGSLLASIGLETGKETQGRWSEIDLVGNKVLLSRGDGMADDAWPNLDEMQVIDIDTGATSPLIFFGAPSFARSAVSTLGLPAIAPGDPLAFYGNGLEPAADAESDPAPEPEPEPEAAPDPAPEDGSIPDESRFPVGDGVNVVAADALIGADGCAGPAGGGVCVGSDFAQATAELDSAFGTGERTDDPATFLEGEPHPAGTHVWADDTWTATVEEIDDVVVALRVAPTDAATIESPLADDLTIGDVLAALGPPADIFQGGGEGVEVLVLEYTTAGATVTYSYVESWGSETRLTDQGGALEKVPAAYDGLPINAYTARAGG